MFIKENNHSVELESMTKQQDRLQELIRLDRELTWFRLTNHMVGGVGAGPGF